MGIFDKFKKGFQKSASAFSSGLKEIIIKKEIDDENLDKIEEFLIQSDVGTEAASEIREIISTKKVDPNKDLTKEINLILREYIISLMKPLENSSFFMKKEKHFLAHSYLFRIVCAFSRPKVPHEATAGFLTIACRFIWLRELIKQHQD